MPPRQWVAETDLSTPIGIIDDSGTKLATVKIVLPGCVCVQKTYRAAVGGALTARELWWRRIWFLPLFVFMLLYGDARPWPYTLWCF